MAELLARVGGSRVLLEAAFHSEFGDFHVGPGSRRDAAHDFQQARIPLPGREFLVSDSPND